MKLFKVMKTDSGYNWSKVEWIKFFLANDEETLEAVIINRYGNLRQYYRHDEEETNITITEYEVETI